MDKNKDIDRLLDFANNEENIDLQEVEKLLGSEDAMEAWREMEDLDEAANRAMGQMPDIDKEWEALKTRVNPKRRFPIWKAVAVAAAVVAIFMVSRVDWSQKETTPEVAALEEIIDKKEAAQAKRVETTTSATTASIHKQRVDVPAGETRNLILPDGTEVCLNAKSTIIYPESFGKKVRRVALYGEAYLKVKRDPGHPFVIHTRNVDTRVIGTEFNVRSYDANDTHVTLVKGLVEVSTIYNRVNIEPNQDASLDGGKLVVADVNPKDYTSWREGVMYFDDASLRTILQQLGAWYDMNIVCNDPRLLDHHFHFIFSKDDSLEEAVNLLNSSSNLDIKVEGNKILIEKYAGYYDFISFSGCPISVSCVMISERDEKSGIICVP